jgi:CPA1 family monovalent cation:H+ antiporter
MHVDSLDIAMIGLLLIISAVGIVTRSLRVPYPIALVIAGLALGVLLRSPLPFVHNLKLDELHLTPHLILVVFLPALLFEATLHIEATTLRKTLLPIALLAIPGVLLTAAIVGALVHWGVGFDWPTALLFGAIVAATDPIAVLAIFKRLGRPTIWRYWSKARACSMMGRRWCSRGSCWALCWPAHSAWPTGC